MRNFAGIFRNMHFCVQQYICFQKQLVIGALKVLAKYLRTIFDKVFKINLVYQTSIKKYKDYL